MRIEELHLLAYGRFTDHRIHTPKSPHDFHVIIGPNEAGKSTLRRAVSELLFGMERQSPLGFKHPQSDLRLSTVLEAGDQKLAFIRSKQLKSLRSLTDEPLPDSFLTPALGSLTADIFEQLHCLSHQQLLKGGQSIIDPRNSVSQILFQAASGLEGFASVREELATRASALFTSRGRSHEFAKTTERYVSAQKTLREVQVRTKQWVEARDQLQHAQDALDSENAHRRAIDSRRTTWERVRRLAPLVERLRRTEQELEDLGDTLIFPADARETLESGISEMNAARGIAETRARDVQERREQLEQIQVDENILSLDADIERLAQLCGQYAGHETELGLRQQEVQQWLGEALTRAAELGWGPAEEDVWKQLPSEKNLRQIESLLRERGAIAAELSAAQQAEEDRAQVLGELQNRANELPEVSPDPRLMQALAQALPLQATKEKQQNLEAAWRQADIAATHALAALGRPALTESTLRALPLPSAARVASYRARRQNLEHDRDMAISLAGQQDALLADLELQIRQFVRSRKVVTAAEVATARGERDRYWSAIQTGEASLRETGTLLDTAIRLADELVDAHTLSETDGAELQALRDRAEKAHLEQARHSAVSQQHAQNLQQFEQQWKAEAAEMGLAGMALDDMPDWLSRREQALQALDLRHTRSTELAQERDRARKAQATLIQAMESSGMPVEDRIELPVLCAQAQAWIKKIEQVQTQRQSVLTQTQEARAALNQAGRTKQAKQEALSQWQARWQNALATAHLSGVSSDLAETEAALEAARFILQRHEKIQSHHSERIEPMNLQLTQLQDAADALTAALTTAPKEARPQDMARHLMVDLQEARRQAHRRAQAQEFLDQAERQLAEARSIVQQTQRRLDPLLEVAGTQDPLSALPLVAKAEHKAVLQASLAETRAQLDQGADGHSLEQLQSEIAAHPPGDAFGELAILQAASEESDRRLTQLVQAQMTARQAFDAMDGGAQAAVAEAHKQEALADLSVTAEDYLQHATSSTLLKWAVDKYRDRKQGPLLHRASAIFSQLTLGSFDKLRIDYDQTPPALLAYRTGNQAVSISGLSDGSRDQLFLALRIAALELQAEQGAAVPFVADDLFINFDDRRSLAGLRALHALSAKTQVLFLTHQEHLLPVIREALPQVNVIELTPDTSPS